MNYYINASTVQFRTVASGTQAAAGSSAAFDLSRARAGTLVAQVGTESAGITFNVERSGTSNGTFAQIGASVSVGGSKLGVIRFTNESSAVWHKVSWNASFTGAVLVLGQGQYFSPIGTLDDEVVSNDDVLV